LTPPTLIIQDDVLHTLSLGQVLVRSIDLARKFKNIPLKKWETENSLVFLSDFTFSSRKAAKLGDSSLVDYQQNATMLWKTTRKCNGIYWWFIHPKTGQN
jgi:hypothetical protein